LPKRALSPQETFKPITFEKILDLYLKGDLQRETRIICRDGQEEALSEITKEKDIILAEIHTETLTKKTIP
jgi:hypothetical protein